MFVISARAVIRARIKSGAINFPLNVVQPFHDTQPSGDAGPIGFSVPVVQEGVQRAELLVEPSAETCKGADYGDDSEY